MTIEEKLDYIISLLEQKDEVKRFQKPTEQEVIDHFILEGHTKFDAISFYSYWESVDWKRGKAKMKNWKAAARNWRKKNYAQSACVTHHEKSALSDGFF